MPKNKTFPLPMSEPGQRENKSDKENTVNEPLSGSKKVKNRNHSRQNHGEGF